MDPINGTSSVSGDKSQSNQTDKTKKTKVHGRTFNVIKDLFGLIERLKKIFILISEIFTKIVHRIFNASKKDEANSEKTSFDIFLNFRNSKNKDSQTPKTKESQNSPCEESTQDHHKTEIPQAKTETPKSAAKKQPQMAQYRSGLEQIRNTVRLNDIPNFKQVMVMDQTQSGLEAANSICGMCSFFNAVVGFGIDKGIEGFSENLLMDKHIFGEFYEYAAKFSLQEDISIANLAILRKSLIEAKDQDLTLFLKRMQTVLKTYPNSFTMLNPSDTDSFTNGLDYSTLHLFSNLKNVVDKPGPLSHSFLVGNNGHWISFTLHKDKEGNYHWYGYDSYDNQTIEFKKKIEILNKILKNLDFHMQDAYYHAIGESSFKGSDLLFTFQGDIKREHGLPCTYKWKKSQEEKIEAIKSGVDFMKKLGWFQSKNSSIQKHVANLKTIVAFYRRERLKEAILKPIVQAEIESYEAQKSEEIISKIVDVYDSEFNDEDMRHMTSAFYSQAIAANPDRKSPLREIALKQSIYLQEVQTELKGRVGSIKAGRENLVKEIQAELKDKTGGIDRVKIKKIFRRECKEALTLIPEALLLTELKNAVYESKKRKLHDLPEGELYELAKNSGTTPDDEVFNFLNELI